MPDNNDDQRKQREHAQGISWDYSNMKSLYANFINVTHTKEEVVVVFGESGDLPAGQREAVIQLKSRIILNPFTAKKMAIILRNILGDHESRYGNIGAAEVPSPENLVHEALMNTMQPYETQGPRGRCNRLLELVNNLHIKFCYEKSVKFFEGRMLVNRFLLSLNKNAIGEGARESILAICRELNMPAGLMKSFDENMPQSDIIHFGFEEDAGRCLYKIYIEPLYELAESNTGGKSPAGGMLFYRGFKWDPEDNGTNSIAIYNHYPELSQKDMLKRISRIYDIEGNHRNWTAYEIAKDILDIACTKIPEHDILYVEVAEENNPRRSFDVNVYDAKLLLRDVYPALSKLCSHYAVPESRFENILQQAGDDLFGHITGGIDRNGNDFFTIYFGVEYIKWIGVS